MTRRPAPRTAALVALLAMLVATLAPPNDPGEPGGDGPGAARGQAPGEAGGDARGEAGGPDRLPRCPAAAATAAGPAPRTPDHLPSSTDPATCRAHPSRVEAAGAGQAPLPRPGYHHLGATTVETWSGILGRLEIRDPGVRTGSYDFVAVRFLAKRQLADGRLGWLEVGWAETGWSGGGVPRIYTFDSESMAWAFYDAYPAADGDRVWIYLHSEPGERWLAWLWWGDQWHLLAAADLPLGERALLEQYVEVHVAGPDRRAPRVPPVRVDRVQVRLDPDAPLTGWQAGTVPTAPLLTSDDYCLTWQRHYDIWSAGDCPATVQE